MRVLLVDSASEVFPDGTAQLLSNSGWTVQTAGDYRQAADLTRSDQFDAIVIPLTANRRATQADDDLTHLIREVDSRRLAAVVLARDDQDRQRGDLRGNTVRGRVGGV